MWGIAAVWTLLTMAGVEVDRRDSDHSPQARKVEISDAEDYPLDEVKKALWIKGTGAETQSVSDISLFQ